MSAQTDTRVEITGNIVVHHPVTVHTARTETAVSCA